MTMGKIAISLPVEQIEQAKRAVADGRAASVSAYISSVLREADPADSMDRLLADLAAQFGEPSEEARAAATAFAARVEARKAEREAHR